MKQMSYSHLYTLNDVNDGLNNFDLSTLPQDYVTNMVVNALQRAPVSKLVKALEIISERYIDAFQNHDQLPLQLVKSITIAQPQLLQPQWQTRRSRSQ